MSEVVGKASRFHHVGIEIPHIFRLGWQFTQKFFGYAPTDLRNLNRMRKAIVKNVPFVRRYDLRDTRKAPERRRIQDAVAVAFRGASIIGLFVLVESLKSKIWFRQSLLPRFASYRVMRNANCHIQRKF